MNRSTAAIHNGVLLEWTERGDVPMIEAAMLEAIDLATWNKSLIGSVVRIAVSSGCSEIPVAEFDVAIDLSARVLNPRQGAE